MNYWLSKFFYDMREPGLRAEFDRDPEGILSRYPLEPDIRRATLEGDIPTLLPLVNPYLLRFYFGDRGMADADFISTVRALQEQR